VPPNHSFTRTRRYGPSIWRASAGPFDAFKLQANDCDVLFASYPAGTSIEPHHHETENIGIKQGELVLTLDGKEHRYGPGDWYHVPARAIHAARFEKDTSEIEFWFCQSSAHADRRSATVTESR
jgi:quercetin dioxygenase-like cupin family protein